MSTKNENTCAVVSCCQQTANCVHAHVLLLQKGLPPSQKPAAIPAGPADRTSSAARLQSALQQRQQGKP